MKRTGVVAILALLATACATTDIQSTEAIRQGVIDHLSGRAGLEISSMDVDVTSVVFRGEEADATVSFRAKGTTDPGSGMMMQYTLVREGSRWVVKDKKEGGAAHHGGMAPGEPGGSGEAPASGELPEGHPPVSP